MTRLAALTWITFFAWLIVGLIIYFAYGRHYSHLNRNAGFPVLSDRRIRRQAEKYHQPRTSSIFLISYRLGEAGWGFFLYKDKG
ncbi:amino acid permease C-terminal domain-containing protein [Paenibacillus sp.]